MTRVDDYDPEASEVIKTICPGCGDEIVIFQSGEIAEEREEPVDNGIPASLIDAAFKPHYCDANDREYVCTHCHSRRPSKQLAEDCCVFAAPRSGAKLVSEFDPREDHDE